MPELTTWMPLALGALIVIAICYKVFTDPTVNNQLGWAFLVAIFLCALPTLQNFSYKGQLGEITTKMKDTVAGQSANLSSDIDEVNKKLDAIVARLNVTPDLLKNTTPEYKKNKASTVLVFYNAAQSSLGEQIRDFLLDAGYKSSASFTDFSELGSNVAPPGTIRISFTSETSNLVPELKAKLKQKFPQIKGFTDRLTDKLNSGDIQIQMF